MENCRKDTEEEPGASSALGAHMMNQPFHPTESSSTDEQVDVDHDGHSDSIFRHDSENSATVSEGAYLLECAEV